MIKVAVFGAGKIGSAVHKILSGPGFPYDIRSFVVDSDQNAISELEGVVLDVANTSVQELTTFLTERGVSHVINAMPFFLNDKIASGAVGACCDYIDFTEDDLMADKVQMIYAETGLNCAVKCGLAPGFINYIGHDLVRQLDSTDSLTISVGALPRTASFYRTNPGGSYNLTWSVDGLVNEYIRPCRVKVLGQVIEVPALGRQIDVILDGVKYEAALTSGGVGSLVHELKDVPNISYKTLRYPGHYDWVRAIVGKYNKDFARIKAEFLSTFPQSNDDVIVVYAEAVGKLDGQLARRTFYDKFYGVDGLTGIQATTAGAGVAMLELMLTSKVSGVPNHTDVKLSDFAATSAFRRFYKTK